MRASIVIQGSDQASPNSEAGSPLAAYLAGKEISDDREAYELVLPEVERVLRNTDEYDPYYSWAETVVRPRLERHDFSALLSHLNRIEQNHDGLWKLDRNEMTSAVKFR